MIENKHSTVKDRQIKRWFFEEAKIPDTFNLKRG